MAGSSKLFTSPVKFHRPLLPLSRSTLLNWEPLNAQFGILRDASLSRAQDLHKGCSGKENALPRDKESSLVRCDRWKHKQNPLFIPSARPLGFHNSHYPTPIKRVRLSREVLSHALPLIARLPCKRLSLVQRLRITKFCNSRPFWLALYFCFNLSLTLHNKLVLVRFPFPYTLTALHALCGSVGGYLLLGSGAFVPARLCPSDMVVLVAFSILYAINIVVSNVSLQLVTVPFHQVVRAMTPLFTIFFTAMILGIRSTRARITTLIPVISGVALATYGDYDFTPCGFFLTLLGSVLAALKTIVTNMLQSSSSQRYFRRLHLHPIDLLIRMSPLAFVHCMLYAQLSGELGRVRHYSSHEMTPLRALALLSNGAIAFGLNVASFTANKKAGPLSMTVAGNVKQVLTILLAVAVFDLKVTWSNGIGMLLTLMGGIWYAAVEYEETDGLQA